MANDYPIPPPKRSGIYGEAVFIARKDGIAKNHQNLQLMAFFSANRVL